MTIYSSVKMIAITLSRKKCFCSCCIVLRPAWIAEIPLEADTSAAMADRNATKPSDCRFRLWIMLSSMVRTSGTIRLRSKISAAVSSAEKPGSRLMTAMARISSGIIAIRMQKAA